MGKIKQIKNSANNERLYPVTVMDAVYDTDGQTVKQKIAAAVAGKQDTLTPGSGISISGGVISCTLDTSLYQVVASLPSSNIDLNKIYLVADASGAGENVYKEYLYTGEKWEEIGSYKAAVDLSPYLKKTEAQNTYATQSALNTAIGSLESAISGKQGALTQGDGIILSGNTISTEMIMGAESTSINDNNIPTLS